MLLHLLYHLLNVYVGLVVVIVGVTFFMVNLKLSVSTDLQHPSTQGLINARSNISIFEFIF